MANTPAPLAAVMNSQGGAVPMCLLDIQLIGGQRLYIADGLISMPSPLGTYDVGGSAVVTYQPWLTQPPEFKITNTLATMTALAAFQNLSGNTVQRDGSLLFSKQTFIGAFFIFRLWKIGAEFALLTFMGKIIDAEPGDEEVELTLNSWLNWSEIAAPEGEIDSSCLNTFGSQACGSVSSTPCQNTRGSCTQPNRFKGYITTWNVDATTPAANPAIAQPVPPAALNPKVAS